MKENKMTMREFVEGNLVSMGASKKEASSIVSLYLEHHRDCDLSVAMESYQVHEIMIMMLDIGRISAEFFKNKKETK